MSHSLLAAQLALTKEGEPRAHEEDLGSLTLYMVFTLSTGVQSSSLEHLFELVLQAGSYCTAVLKTSPSNKQPERIDKYQVPLKV